MSLRMRNMKLIVAILTASLIWQANASANDSMAEVALGGLTLIETDAVSLDSEELYISRNEVRVDYRFTNTTDKDIEALVAFPLPEQKMADADSDGYLRDYRAELDFSTRVDGIPVAFTVVEQALFKGVDISQRLKALGLALVGLQEFEAFQATVAKLPETEKLALLREGIIADEGTAGSPAYRSMWDLRTTVTRKQLFPAGKTLKVQHRYRPLVGGSVGGSLMPNARGEEWGLMMQKRYCIEDSWYKAFDKAIKPRITEDNPVPYTETWIGYVLKSGASWKGPIKDFRLVVDKGEAENLVSFCAEGVKKISDTQFEVRKKDFEPKEDLNVLIVEWSKGLAQ